MDLTRALPALAALGILLGSTSGCDEGLPVEYSDRQVLFPATLLDALPLATTIALDWDENAYLWGLGGAHTILDNTGHGGTLSYRFYSRRSERRLDVHLFSGTPWAGDVVLLDAPAPLPGAATLVDSDEAVTRALGIADSLNTVAPGTIPEASTFSARLLSYPVWPEPGTVYATTDSIAWRVDLMTYREYGGEEGAPPESTYFSLARFYLSPTTGLLLDDGESPNPVVHEEIYPFP